MANMIKSHKSTASFGLIAIALEIANDLVAFDGHLVCLFANETNPPCIWHYEDGPKYSGAGVRSGMQSLRTLDGQISKETRYRRGVLKRNSRSYCVPIQSMTMRYGLIGFERSSKVPFSEEDIQLLQTVFTLCAASFEASSTKALLNSLHLQLLHRRTEISSMDQADDVLRAYLMKAQSVCHPQESAQDAKIRVSAKLINTNRMALYLRAIHSSETSEIPNLDSSFRYDVDNPKSIAARVFTSRLSYLCNNYPRKCPKPFRVFLDTESHISSPIIENGSVIGILSIETTLPNNYSHEHVLAMTLIAAHCAKPLRHAHDRECMLARLKDIQNIQDATIRLHESASTDCVFHTLRDCLVKLRYRRGLICRVDHASGSVTGHIAWGPKFAELSNKTHRDFDRDKMDVQVQAVLKRCSQRIDDPQKNRAAHRDALTTAKLVPFAVIPLMSSSGIPLWTLHVERDDTSPLANDELRDIEELARLAVTEIERIQHLAEKENQIRLDALSVSWASELASKVVITEEAFRRLANFIVDQKIAKRCLVFERGDRAWRGVTMSTASKLRAVDAFEGLRIPMPKTNSTLELLMSRKKPIVVRWQKRAPFFFCLTPSGEPSEFPTAIQTPFTKSKELGLELITEWVEVPLFRGASLIAMALLERYEDDRTAHVSGATCFSTSDLRLIDEIARTTSMGLDRLQAEESFAHEAMLAACMALYGHEVKSRFYAIRDEATAMKLDRLPSKTMNSVLRLKRTVNAELDQVQSIMAFFKDDVMAPNLGESYVTVDSEIRKAKHLLRSDYVTVSKTKCTYRVPARNRPLCLVLIQLISNAIRFTFESDPPLIDVSIHVDRRSHSCIIRVSDNGSGFSGDIDCFRTGIGIPISDCGHGLGLRSAFLISRAHGWSLQLSSRGGTPKEQTCWELILPKEYNGSR